MNIKLLATEVGNLLKYDTSINEINRAGGAVFPFRSDRFPNDAITSQRAQLVYDWIMTAGRTPMEGQKRIDLLRQFCDTITPADKREALADIFARCLGQSGQQDLLRQEFEQRGFHQQIHAHAKKLFCQANFFHAVFEACKAYNKEVRTKSQSTKDGADLMLAVWGPDTGCLKITPCQTETDKNVQDGVKFLSAGLMRAVRNPTSHEPAIHWPISKQDCLDLLGFVSFLFRQLDAATHYPCAKKHP
jgi:uncharacterized protein (TIGR02391 family)